MNLPDKIGNKKEDSNVVKTAAQMIEEAREKARKKEELRKINDRKCAKESNDINKAGGRSNGGDESGRVVQSEPVGWAENEQ